MPAFRLTQLVVFVYTHFLWNSRYHFRRKTNLCSGRFTPKSPSCRTRKARMMLEARWRRSAIVLLLVLTSGLGYSQSCLSTQGTWTFFYDNSVCVIAQDGKRQPERVRHGELLSWDGKLVVGRNHQWKFPPVCRDQSRELRQGPVDTIQRHSGSTPAATTYTEADQLVG
jgi:hypothetical protein